MEEAAATRRAREAVAAFLRGGSDRDSSSSDEADLGAARPARLGLGASHVPQPESVTRAEARLQRELRKERERAERDKEEDNSSSSEDDAAESRTRAVGKRRKPRKKARRVGGSKKAAGESKAGGATDAPVALPAAASVGKMTDKPDTRPPAVTKPAPARLDFAPPTTAPSNVNSAPVDSAAPVPRRKRTRTRSRQKNLRRDKRPRHLLPAHLTAETLARGRVRPEMYGVDGGPAE